MKIQQFGRFLFAPLLLIIFTAIQIAAQTNNDSLTDKRITIHRANESLGVVFRDLIEIYDVPIGFEESKLDASHSDYLFEPNISFDDDSCCTNCGGVGVKCKQRVFKANNIKFTVNVDNEPLANVLDIIVSQMKNYKWEINDDVVNFVPINGREERFENLLNLRIKDFSVQKYTGNKSKTLYDIRMSIMLTTEVRNFIDANNFVFTSSRYTSENLKRSLPSEMNFSDLTLRELLNKIAKIKRGGWALRMNDFFEKTKYEAIDIDI